MFRCKIVPETQQKPGSKELFIPESRLTVIQLIVRLFLNNQQKIAQTLRYLFKGLQRQ